MKHLMEDIEEILRDYYEDKTGNADIPERAEDAIYERVTLLLNDIESLIDTANNDVDEVVEEFSEDNLKAIKTDRRTQDYLEAV